MKSVMSRMQLWLIAAGYAAVIAIGTVLLLARHILEITHRADVAAAGGMYAFGDLMLWMFIAGLFLIPTLVLLWFLAKSEAIYTTYSQLLLGFSLSAPVCLALLYLDLKRVPQTLAFLCWCRMVGSPLILAGIVVSRLVARFPRAKKLTLYALIVEGLSLAIAIALLFKQH